MNAPIRDFLDVARQQINEQQPDMNLARPGVAVVLFPHNTTCDCGGDALAVEVAVAAHPEAFDDMAVVVDALRKLANHLQQQIGEANYQMAEIRREQQR
ncbi:hypothetical protein SEA_BARB_69 [Gordonia phage Barb]|uniref:Uncharacterized protein n=1 Tax=Gordonia phage Barb TaxID=2588128 RepID=A0A4Y5U062_9CAUD|nr:hypothetical protein KNU55_gp69 [Gordonia phage Barb]QDB74745.1 hypothetical protein SEA_BARB_69 [Gordonia phage Barb]QXO14448.1 hypothetical protein SEA_FUGAX_70 [Gordonia phage Fugax]WNM73183.1 hypothetical protein SEA_CLAMCHOWDER_69 [Gordonia phage ClamChowder]